MEIKTDNGWFHINDIKPNEEEEVIVIVERESSMGCTYDFDICKSIYRNGNPNGYFLIENSVWKVRYWRRKEIYPYPNAIVKKEIDECRKHNISPQKIIEHQRKCGIKEYTMRSAFKRWLILHNEEWRNTGYIRIPNWFRHYIRQNTDWSYTVTDERTARHCNKCELNWDARRRYKGYYSFYISDEELLKLQRAEWIK